MKKHRVNVFALQWLRMAVSNSFPCWFRIWHVTRLVQIFKIEICIYNFADLGNEALLSRHLHMRTMAARELSSWYRNLWLHSRSMHAFIICIAQWWILTYWWENMTPTFWNWVFSWNDMKAKANPIHSNVFSAFTPPPFAKHTYF